MRDQCGTVRRGWHRPKALHLSWVEGAPLAPESRSTPRLSNPGYPSLVDLEGRPPWSGKQLKRLGLAIVDPGHAGGEFPPYAEVMGWHADLADEVSTQIADRTWGSLSGQMDVSSRAKTVDTLREKLIRETHLKLNQIQDLAGVRVDFDGNLDEQSKFPEELAAHFGGDPRAVVKDIRQRPHSGYRAVHLWLKLPAGRVEIQLRTRYQSAWANLYE